jgi:hypothetical protein
MPSPQLLFFGLSLFVGVFLAFRKGGKDEKTVAVALVAAAVLSPFAQAPSFETEQYGLIVVDAVLLSVLTVVALRSDRYWPMAAASFQLTTILIHVAGGNSSGVVPIAYADSIVFWGYLVLASLVIGTLIETNEVRS